MASSAADHRRAPPTLSDDAAPIFWSKAHSLAFSRLGFAAKSRAPVTLFLGEAGAGRSRLVRELAESCGAGMAVGVIGDARAMPDEVDAVVAEAFGARREAGAESASGRERLQAVLAARAAAGDSPVLIVDDAEQLSQAALASLLALVSGSDPVAGPLKLILVGAPELSGVLDRGWPDLAGPGFQLTGMSQDETALYLRQRLAAAGTTDTIFDTEALAEIFDLSGGLPGRINALCDACLRRVDRAGVARIDRKLVRQAVPAARIHGLTDTGRRDPRPQESPLRLESPLPEAEPAPEGEANPPRDTPADASAPAPERPEPGLRLQMAMEKIKAEASAGKRGKAGNAPGNAGTKAPGASPAAPRHGSRGAVPARPNPAFWADAPPDPPARPDAGEDTAQATPARAGKPERTRWAAAVLLALAGGAGFWLWQNPGDGGRERPAAIREPVEPAAPAPVAVAESPPEAAESAAEAQPRQGGLGERLAGYPATAEDRFRFALDLAGRDPVAAAAGYAGAALLGHQRAAYYLGQIYETGDGVPVDRALARAWYGRAETGVPGAATLRDALSPPQEEGEIAAPLPLFAGAAGPDRIELIWTSGEGADPSGYRVELAAETGEIVLRSDPQTLSAIRIALPEPARRWRVVAIGAQGQDEAASPWLPIDRD